MDIYRHKNYGLVIFEGAIQIKTRFGKFKPGVLFRRLTIENNPNFDETGKGVGKAVAEDQMRAILYSEWKPFVKRVGNGTRQIPLSHPESDQNLDIATVETGKSNEEAKATGAIALEEVQKLP